MQVFRFIPKIWILLAQTIRQHCFLLLLRTKKKRYYWFQIYLYTCYSYSRDIQQCLSECQTEIDITICLFCPCVLKNIHKKQKKIDISTSRQIDRQTDRNTDRHTDRREGVKKSKQVDACQIRKSGLWGPSRGHPISLNLHRICS